MDKEQIQSAIKTTLLAFIIIALGLFIVNQYVKLTYATNLIREPCGVCLYEHPNIHLCKEYGNATATSYFTDVNWSNILDSIVVLDNETQDT